MTPFRSRFAARRLAEKADGSLNDPPQTGDNAAKDYRRDHEKYPGSPILTCYFRQHNSFPRTATPNFSAASRMAAISAAEAPSQKNRRRWYATPHVCSLKRKELLKLMTQVPGPIYFWVCAHQMPACHAGKPVAALRRCRGQ